LKIAVVGAGIAGLAAASKLHKKGHDVYVYESSKEIGGHVKTVSIPSSSNDRPDILELGVFMHDPVAIHPTMCRLAKEFGITSQPFSLTTTVEQEKSHIFWTTCQKIPRFLASYPTLSEYCLHSKMGFDALKNGWQSFSHLIELSRFFRAIKNDKNCYGNISVQEALNQNLFSQKFINGWLLPQMFCWWGVPKLYAMQCSLKLVVDSIAKVAKYPQYIFPNGWNQLIKAIACSLPQNNIYLNTEVQAISRSPKAVEVTTKSGKTNYGAVIFATPPSITRKILKDKDLNEERILNSFQTTTTEVYLHKDTSWLPKRQKKAIINLISNERGDFCTFWCGGLLKGRPDLFISWGDQLQHLPKNSLVLSKGSFERTLPTMSYLSSCKEIQKIQGNGNIWHAGAHVHALKENETPSLWHENALLSGFLVSNQEV